MKRKQDIRSHLSQLKKDRRDMKAALEASTGEPHPDPGEGTSADRADLCCPGKRSHALLSERLKKTEEECKQKEEECVNLELELTEVKENLKKALSGGVTLGLTIQPKSGSPGLQVRSHPASLLFLSAGASAHSTLLSVCSRPPCRGGLSSPRRFPAATPATRSPARCPSTAPRCSAGSRSARSPRRCGDTS